jgi:hypothetical protein
VIIDIYGLVIKCQTASADLGCELIRPFKYFRKDEGAPDVTIIVEEKEPPYATFPNLKASFSTPRNIVYADKDCKIIDYFGKGVILENGDKTVFTLYSRDGNFLQEAFYLLVLSLFGQHCDRNGMMRVHALALSYKDTAILLPVPPGGGKSTMALAMLEEKDFKLISDDEPVLDGAGHILPFPLRIGTLDKNKIKSIPAEFVYQIDRMEFGLKYFIDIHYWEHKLEHRPLQKSLLFVSYRSLNGAASIEKASKRKVFAALIRDAVIGVGLYQGVEFLFSHSPWEVLAKIRIAFKRFSAALKLTLASQTYQIVLSRDISQNARVFAEFIRKTI